MTKEFEISLPKAVYFGTWTVSNGKFEILEMTTQDEDENEIEVCSISDKEIYNRVKNLVIEQNKDEIEEEIEDYETEMKKSRLTDF